MPDGNERIEVEGVVIEALPNAVYRVELQREPRTRVLAHVASAGMLRVLPGDVVRVEIMPYDASRGRIVGRRA